MRPQCTIPDCLKPQTARGLCAAHYHHALMAEPRPPCSVDGCERPSRTKGLCNTHYVQAGRTGGDPTGHLPGRKPKPCSVDGCERKAVAFGLCFLHDQRMKRSGTTDTPVVSLSDEARFWTYAGTVDRDPVPCWLWTGGLTAQGYGKFKAGGKTVPAHAYSYRLACPETPDDAYILHRCPGGPNRRCVNPTHLYAGTAYDNAQDAKADGTIRRGESHPEAKLTDADVREIRRRYDAGESAAVLGRDFGISTVNASRIVRRLAWKHVS